jgi:hypothetical protein
MQAKNLSLPSSSSTLESHLSAHAPLHTSLLLGPLPLLLAPADPASSGISHTLSHLSTLLCITSLLRSLPILVSKRSLNIPADVRERHGVVEEDVLRNGAAAKGVRDACYEIGTRGMDELITARRETKGAGGRVEPKSVRPLFLSAVRGHVVATGLSKERRTDRLDTGRAILEEIGGVRFRRLPSGPAAPGLEARPDYLVAQSNREIIVQQADSPHSTTARVLHTSSATAHPAHRGWEVRSVRQCCSTSHRICDIRVVAYLA